MDNTEPIPTTRSATSPVTEVGARVDDPEWDARLAYWRRKLGRLRLGVEPIEDQVARYFRVTVALTVVPGVIALMFLALFTAFRRPDVGLVIVAVFLAPIVVLAWLDFALLRFRASSYLRDVTAHNQSPGRLQSRDEEEEREV